SPGLSGRCGQQHRGGPGQALCRHSGDANGADRSQPQPAAGIPARRPAERAARGHLAGRPGGRSAGTGTAGGGAMSSGYQRGSGGWLVALTLVAAAILAIVPLPNWLEFWRPEWVALVFIYWVIALPHK